jgi:AcrR family transcriptional regulator
MNDQNLILVPSRPTRADAVKNRRVLLDTARRLFSQRGVEAVCMSLIAEEAGVGKGTLYRHFTNKTELCQALLDDDQRELQERAFEKLRSGIPPLESLRWFLPEVAAFVDRNMEFLHTGAAGAAGSALAYPAHSWWRQTIRGLLQMLHTRGDLEYLSDVLYVMLDVQTIHFQRHVLGYSFERVINGLLDTLERLTA